MLLYHIVILALIQGLTEFLPVSSSGHLAIAHNFMGHSLIISSQQVLMLDIAVHVGTLFSVLLYFRHDIWSILCNIFAIGQRQDNQGIKLAIKIILGSIPVIAAGLLIKIIFGQGLGDNITLIAWMTIIFGVILWAADRFAPQTKDVEDIGYVSAFLIGLSQALALIPGVSRSGITMTSGRLLGLSPAQAARFSLLLGIVAISGAGALLGLDLLEVDNASFGLDILLATALSFIAGWASIALMLKWLEKHGFGIFVLYRILLGIGLLVIFA